MEVKSLKIAFITGTSSGIGKGIGEYLLKKGWNVYGCALHNPNPTGSIITFSMDVSRPDDWLKILTRLPMLDLLINNAGILRFDEYNEARSIVETNLLGVFYGCTFALNYVKEKGSVINIASTSGVNPEPELPLYSATKAGVIHMTKSFAKQTRRIRFNCISPGFVRTNLVPGEVSKELLKHVLEQRVAKPIEIAKVVEFIIKTPYLHGANIIVDGGSGLW